MPLKLSVIIVDSDCNLRAKVITLNPDEQYDNEDGYVLFRVRNDASFSLRKDRADVSNVNSAFITLNMSLENLVEWKLPYSEWSATRPISWGESVANTYHLMAFDTWAVVESLKTSGKRKSMDEIFSSECNSHRRLKAARLEIQTTSQSPSVIADQSNIRSLQSNPAEQFLCGRPYHLHAHTPPVLMDENLNRVQNDLYHGIPDQIDWEAANKLAPALADIYGLEASREERIAEVVRESLGIWISRTETDSSTSVFLTNDSTDPPSCQRIIVEFKNEMSSGSAEPSFQVIAYYDRGCRDILKTYRGVCDDRMPCLLIVIAGPLIWVGAATYEGRPSVQPLAALLGNAHPTDHNQRLQLARFCCAFRRAYTELTAHYQQVRPTWTEGPARDCSQLHFPFIKTFESGEQEWNLVYDGCMGHRPSLTFCGTATAGSQKRKVIVKIVPGGVYGEECHRAMVAAGFAPNILSLFYLPNRDLCIVMDDIKATGFLPCTLKESSAGDVPVGLVKLLADLQASSFIHGDIRPSNVMAKKTDKGDIQFMLLDFDWAGRPGSARYPHNLNSAATGRAVDGQPVGVPSGLMGLQDDERTASRIGLPSEYRDT